MAEPPWLDRQGHTLSRFMQPQLSSVGETQILEPPPCHYVCGWRRARVINEVNEVEEIGPDPQAPAAVQVPAADLDDDSEMWKLFLDEVKEEDIRFTDAWKEDANSIIVFTGLFSAIVGAFIIEFYKTLSPNSNTANQPSSPGTAMVWANALWLISLVLSLTCALIATLLQQWARRYIETPKFTNVLRHRARVRSLLLTGTKSYNIPIIVEMLPTLLHLSVYLFLAGLAIAFHTINKTVSIAVDIAVGVSGLAYLALSILPCLDVRCPYRTPISQILWYPCRAILSFTAPLLRECILELREFLNQPAESSGLSFSNHWRCFRDGLEKSIVYRAVETLKDGDRERVTWLFNELALGDRRTFIKFAASIPIHKIRDLIPSIESVSFRDSLLVLLRSVAGTRSIAAAWIDSDVHKRSLTVCLHAICHTVKAKDPTAPDLNFMRDHFADTGRMRALWNDDDNSIRIASRSICALVASHVVRKRPLKDEDLDWLQEVTGSSSEAILAADITIRDQINFKSFVYGVLLHNASHLSTHDTTSFNETLAVLLGVKTYDRQYFTTPAWQSRLSEEVRKIQRYDSQGALEVFDALHSVFPSLPPVTSTDAAVPPPATSTDAAVLPLTTSTDAAVPPSVTSTDAAVPPPATSTDAAVPPPATSTDAAAPPPATSTDAAVPPSVTSADAAVPPLTTSTDAAVPSSATSADAAVPPSVTSTDAAVLPPATPTDAAVPPSVTSADAAVPPPVTSADAAVPPSVTYVDAVLPLSSTSTP